MKRDIRSDVSFRGGDKRDRTADLLNAIQALSQAIISMPPFMSNGNDKERNFYAIWTDLAVVAGYAVCCVSYENDCNPSVYGGEL